MIVNELHHSEPVSHYSCQMSPEKLYDILIKGALRAFALLMEADYYAAENFDSIITREARDKCRKAKASWPQLIKRALLLWCSGLTFLAACVQYAYDYQKITHQLLNSVVNEYRLPNETSSSQTKKIKQQLHLIEEKIATYETVLKYIGDPFEDLKMFRECFGVFVVSGTLVAFISSTVYFRFIAPLNFSLIRLFLDEKREQRIIDTLIDEVCFKTTVSSYRYLILTSRSRNCSLKTTKCGPYAHQITHNLTIQADSKQLKNFDLHNPIAHYLEDLRQQGSFKLPNRKEKWVAVLRRRFAVFILSDLYPICTIHILYVLFGYNHVSMTKNPLFELTSLLIMYIFTITTVSVTHTSSCFLHCLASDQSHAATEIIKLVENCVAQNTIATREFLELSAQLRTEQPILNENSNRLSDYINQNLTSVIMNYRIFVRQFLPIKHYYSYLVTVTTCFFTIYPFFVILHATYLSNNYRFFIILVYWSSLFWYNCQIFQVCVFHAQVQQLFRHLFYLMAHIDRNIERFKSMGNRIDAKQIYNPFLVLLLRREISNPRLAIDKLSITILGYPVTYKHLLRMFFWVGLLSIYTLFSPYNSGSSNIERTNSVSFLGLFG